MLNLENMMEDIFEGRSVCPSSSSFSPFSFLAFASITINTVINVNSIINTNNNNNNNINDLTSMNMNTGAGRRRKRSLGELFDIDRLEEILFELERESEGGGKNCGFGFPGFLQWIQETLEDNSPCFGQIMCEGIKNMFSWRPLQSFEIIGDFCFSLEDCSL